MAVRHQSQTNMTLIGAIVAVATIGGLLFGYDSGAVNGTQAGLKAAFALSDGGLGFTVGSLLIGCGVGAFLAGRLADRFGRKKVMIIAAIMFFAGALVQGLTSVHLFFMIARFGGGMAVGAASVLSPAYISEVAPAAIRGRLTSVQQVMIISGLTLAFVVNYFVAQAAGDSLGELAGHPAWRWMYLAQTVPAVVFLVALQFIPESPHYLVSSGQGEEALAVLTRLFGQAEADRKYADIKASFAQDHRPRLADVTAPGTVLRPVVWAGLLLATFQQFVGINVIFYYGETLWKLAGVSEQAALERNIISGLVSVAACLVTMALVDRVGRKPLLLVGSVGMTAALGTMTYAFSRGTLDATGALSLTHNYGMIAVVAANLYVVFFNISWGPIMWVMLGEMFPNQLRGSALAVCGLVQWAANFLVVQSFPGMAKGLGLTPTYLIYTLSAFVSFWLVRAFLPETAGKELEEMEGWSSDGH